MFAFNKRALIKEFNEKTQLTPLETELFKIRCNNKMDSLEQSAHLKYDSTKNWSIMIKQQSNDLRNEVMRRTKSFQIKKQNLHAV